MFDAPVARCIICPRQLLDHETGRYLCTLCEQRIDRDLAALAGPAGLYARLCLRIQPGCRGDGPAVSGTPGRELPGGEPLNLTANGGIVSDLETWVRDWATYGLATIGTGGRLQHRIDQAVATLRLNLPRAVYRHPALDDFGKEITQARARAEAIINGEQEPRRIAVQCGCGAVSKVTLDTDGFTCRGCRTEYGHTEALSLPMAARAAA
ncbi:hypothetical protein [Streptomyces sp. UH6]|uniref:hypothetical protein n=1 Tax=Streptomyces sp. UH6 TaxID=2748379 RepID=UPI0015D498F6|nr:hypothetical protein [Streptomyces sp. UH6]NYV73129.1 hypothetical protein [Streptomyces sp. UH6]